MYLHTVHRHRAQFANSDDKSVLLRWHKLTTDTVCHRSPLSESLEIQWWDRSEANDCLLYHIPSLQNINKILNLRLRKKKKLFIPYLPILNSL